VPVADQERAARAAPSGLLLEIDLLAFDRVGQQVGREFGERALDEGLQPSTSLDLISARTKRRHWHPFDVALSD
jgi:hypothetical protein